MPRKKPSPGAETLSALLVSASGRPTRHTYQRSHETVSETTGERGIAHVFACDETGEERRWGFDRLSDRRSR